MISLYNSLILTERKRRNAEPERFLVAETRFGGATALPLLLHPLKRPDQPLEHFVLLSDTHTDANSASQHVFRDVLTTPTRAVY